MLTAITSLTSYLGMIISMWLGMYLLSRGNGNKASVRIFMALLALALYYYNSFSASLDPAAGNESVREFAVIIALVAWHQLTLFFLPEKLQKKLEWTSYLALLFGVLAAVILFTTHAQSGQDPNYIYPVELNSSYFVVGALQVLIAIGAIYNVSLIASNKSWPETRVFFVSLGIGLLTILYGLMGSILNIPLPRFIATLTLLITFVLLSYSVAKYQAMVERRISLEDLPISAVLIFSLTALYVLALRGHGLSVSEIAFVSVLVIASHSIYDLVYSFLDRLFHRREREAFGEIRHLAHTKGSASTLKPNLTRGLTILCRNLQASGGFIALPEGDDYSVVASLNSLSSNTKLPAKEVALEKATQAQGALVEGVVWLTPAFGGGSQIGVVGIGPRLGDKEYTEGDVFWMEDFADQVGALILAHGQRAQANSRPGAGYSGEDMLNALAYQPDAKLVKLVEESLRNLNDYVKLGDSAMVKILAASGRTNIERGKAVQQKLTQIIDTLRPAAKQPAEPLPREWHSYAILHDAYAEEVPDRDIMGKLYISEGTFYRARRKALHGVAKAVLEREARG